MTYQALETSVEGGAPVELYEFAYQNVLTRWTSADRDIVLGPSTYLTASIVRSEIEDAGQNVSNPSITLTVRTDFVPIQVFSAYPPSDVVNLTIRRFHLGDTSDIVVIWSGRVLSVSWGNDEAKVTCQNLYTRLKQTGLRRLYGRNCPHVLYSQGDGECRLARASFAVPGTLLSASGVTIVATAFGSEADGFFNGGALEIETAPGVFQRRGIKTHVGTTITITHPLAELVTGASVTVYPGCDKTQATCITKFNNVLNFGGFPYTPKKNPFGSNSVF